MPAAAQFIPGGLAFRAVETLGPLAVGSGVFLGVAWLLRLPEASLLVARRRQETTTGE